MNEKNKFNQPVGGMVENWCGARRPAESVLRGRDCILEPVNVKRHGAQLFDSLSLDNRGESWTYLPYGPFDTVDQFEHWLEETSLEKDTFLYAIFDSKTQAPIGVAGYLRINPEHGVIEVGHIHFSQLLKKTTAATEAMYLMMHNAFEQLGYRRYEWKCHSLNQASRNAALRLGFTFEGIFRQSNVFKNRNRDTAWFSIIDSEWPKIKDKFSQWLSPDNFDNHGNQIQKLSRIKS